MTLKALMSKVHFWYVGTSFKS